MNETSLSYSLYASRKAEVMDLMNKRFMTMALCHPKQENNALIILKNKGRKGQEESRLSRYDWAEWI